MVSLPERPLVKPWYRLAPTARGLAFEYGHHVVSLEGRAVERLLPALLPLLDGTRPLADVTGYLGESAEPAVENALRVLAEHGVLTEGPPLADVAGPFALAATAAAARGGPPPDAVRAALAASTALVVGSAAAGVEIARLLALSGVGDVRRGGWEGGDADLVLVVPDAAEVPRVAGWNRRALELRARWLQVLPFDGRLAAVGPLYLPGETCCYECFRLRRAANSGYHDEFWELEREPTAAAQDPAFTAVLAGVAAAVAVRTLALEDPFAAGIFYALEHGERLALEPHHVYRVPRCPACSDAAATGPPVPWVDA